MLVPFNTMPDTSRVWIYQAEKKLSAPEVEFVNKASEMFLNQWQTHGKDLKASFTLEYDQFLVISVDESHQQASGCSIDASVHLIQKIEQELGLSFTTNGQVAFFVDEQVVLKPFNTIKKSIESKEIGADTKMFDNSIQRLSEFKNNWPAQTNMTWAARFF